MSEPKQLSPFGSLIFNVESQILQSNDTFAKWLEFEASELEGQRLDQLLDGGAKFYYQSQVLPSLNLNGCIEELYLSILSKENKPVPFLINIQRILRDGEPFYEAALVRIQARAKLEDELFIAKKQAEVANEARSKFLAMMSHELRTPLHTMRMSTDLLLDKNVGDLTREQKELIGIAHESSASLSRLIEDILNYAKLQHGNLSVEPTIVSLESVLMRAEMLTMDRIKEAGIGYHRLQQNDDLELLVDPDRLLQIFINLINNAIKFTPENGLISIVVKIEAQRVYIEISDTGCGIPEADISRIFDPFTQLVHPHSKKTSGGVGLGLAICKELAQAMSGDLQVASTLEIGSIFTLILPSLKKQAS